MWPLEDAALCCCVRCASLVGSCFVVRGFAAHSARSSAPLSLLRRAESPHRTVGEPCRRRLLSLHRQPCAAAMSDCPRCATVQREYEEFQEQSAELEAELEKELKAAQDNLAVAKTKLDKVRAAAATEAQGRGKRNRISGVMCMRREAPPRPRRCAER